MMSLTPLLSKVQRWFEMVLNNFNDFIFLRLTRGIFLIRLSATASVVRSHVYPIYFSPVPQSRGVAAASTCRENAAQGVGGVGGAG